MELTRLFRKFLYFGLGFILLSMALQWAYVTKVVGKGKAEERKREIRERKEEVKFLFMGDSHAMKAVDTERIPGSFMYAFTSESYILNLLRFKDLLDHGIRPKALVLPLDLHSFAPFRADFIAEDSDLLRDPAYLELGRRQGKFVRHFARHIRARAFSYVGNYRRIAYAIWPVVPSHIELEGGEWLQMDSTGMAMFDADLAVDGRLSARQHFEGAGPYPDPLLTEALHDIISLCSEQGIKVALVRYPLAPSYHGEALRLLAAKGARPVRNFHHKGKAIPIFDGSELYNEQPGYFLDSHHLNPKGRKAFSDRLGAWLEEWVETN